MSVGCRLFGRHVMTAIPPHCVHPAAGPIGLVIAPTVRESLEAERFGSPVLSVPMRHPDGEGPYQVWRGADELMLRIAPVVEFSCTGDRLEYRCITPLPLESLQWQTFGLVLSAWSEWAGRPVLHAATVQVERAAVGFLGRSGIGKSSLTLEFLRNGHRMLGDDQLILESTAEGIMALPAIPWLKLGPDVVARTGLRDLPPIHSRSDKKRLDVVPGQWADGPVPLGPVYVVERGWNRPEVVIAPVAAGEGLLALIRHTYVPRTVMAAGLPTQRLPILSRAVEQAGVWSLRYPDGVEWLPRVREAVVRHVADRANESPVPSPR